MDPFCRDIQRSGQWQINHQSESNGNGNVGRIDLELIPETDHTRKEISLVHPDKHCEKDPQSQKTIQEREFSSNLFLNHLQNPP
jgi:hypothetical protein